VEPETMTVPIEFIATLYMESLLPLKDDAGDIQWHVITTQLVAIEPTKSH
jgi:hypothetical protein